MAKKAIKSTKNTEKADKKDFGIGVEEVISKSKSKKKLGSSGTKISGGRIYEEYSNKIKNKKKRYQMYQEMDNDSTVFIVRDSINKAKQTADVAIEPYTDGKSKPSKKDIAIAELVEDNLKNRMYDGWNRLLENISLYVRDGFSVFEYYFVEQDGNQYIQIDRFAATTVEKWETENGEPGITQQLTYAKIQTTKNDENVGKNLISIPAEKLILFNINAEGQNYEGVPLYRKMLRDWFYKDKFETYNAILQERFCVPAVKVKAARGTAEGVQDELLNTARNIHSSEEGAVIELYDLSVDGNKTLPVVEYEVMKNDYTDTKIQESITRYDQNIKDSFYAQFLYLGKSQVGSYALGDSSKNFYMQAIQSLLEYDIDIINQYIIPKIVVMNGGDINRLPKLEIKTLGFVDIPTFSDNINKLAASGMVTKTIETENHIRDLSGLPEIDKKDFKENQVSEEVKVANPK